MSAPLHMVKLCVGADVVDDLREWQGGRIAERRKAGLDPRPRHVTRMWPRRSDEILAGGSLFWVFRGAVLARQRIEDLQEVIGQDGIRRCAIVMSPEIVLVETRPRRPFQGWRYLNAKDAPPDIRNQSADTVTLPPKLAIALDDLGVVAR
ncbi:MAG: DUF1489 domain-containing protein [Pseudomonadota bacterium]